MALVTGFLQLCSLLLVICVALSNALLLDKKPQSEQEDHLEMMNESIKKDPITSDDDLPKEDIDEFQS